jgi:hypothetical protein
MPYFLDIALRQAFDDMPLDRDDRRCWYDGKARETLAGAPFPHAL